MATDFWSSTHYKRWLVDRATLRQARADDLLYVDDPEHLDFLALYFGELIVKLGRKLRVLPQRVIATATVFFRRFYLKNSYCETDPFIVVAACCYLAAKAEEFPMHIKVIAVDARDLFAQEPYNVKNFPSDNAKLAEMEFYLVDDLECDLTVFHPYRTLLALCKKSDASGDPADEEEAGELGVGIVGEDGPRYWGTGQGQLELPPNGLQTAWFIVNDTYRSELCLLYSPHLLAVAALYMTCVFHPATAARLASASAAAPGGSGGAPDPPPRRSSRQAAERKLPAQDPLAFLAALNVSLPLVATIVQEIIAMYALWDRYKEDAATADPGGTPDSRGDDEGGVVTPAQLTAILSKMREARAQEVAHPSNGRPFAVNKMLERTQAAG
ncbi:cyclin-like protein [Mycena belliarum]|uniref:Cyclin-like protein n=1 Tax=Mycena belliarum TaxID=1033014 RepID=A0AAD6TZP2_9AGAR|nr:cyclin-like protein [Mycena belliae]